MLWVGMWWVLVWKGSAGEYGWGGAAATVYWADPAVRFCFTGRQAGNTLSSASYLRLQYFSRSFISLFSVSD